MIYTAHIYIYIYIYIYILLFCSIHSLLTVFQFHRLIFIEVLIDTTELPKMEVTQNLAGKVLRTA